MKIINTMKSCDRCDELVNIGVSHCQACWDALKKSEKPTAPCEDCLSAQSFHGDADAMCAVCELRDGWRRVYNAPPNPDPLDLFRVKLQLFRRDEYARRVVALDHRLERAAALKPLWMNPEDALIALRAVELQPAPLADALKRHGDKLAAALDGLDEASEALELHTYSRPAAVSPEEWIARPADLQGELERRQREAAASEKLDCPECGGAGEWQGDAHTKMHGGYPCGVCLGKGTIDAPAVETMAVPIVRAEELDTSMRIGEALDALDGPLAGETMASYHKRAALELFAHQLGADEDDTRAELREALEHAINAAVLQAQDTMGAQLERAADALQEQTRIMLQGFQLRAVREVFQMLNAATGGALRALDARDEDDESPVD